MTADATWSKTKHIHLIRNLTKTEKTLFTQKTHACGSLSILKMHVFEGERQSEGWRKREREGGRVDFGLLPTPCNRHKLVM